MQERPPSSSAFPQFGHGPRGRLSMGQFVTNDPNVATFEASAKWSQLMPHLPLRWLQG